VKSRPGDTRFFVRIPLQQPRFHNNNQPQQEQEAAS